MLKEELEEIIETLGKVLITPKGEYDPTASYKFLDIVTADGGSFLAKKPSINVPVSNATYWLKLAEKGNTGEAAGFGTPTATATGLEAGSEPTVEVTDDGTDAEKVFHFSFGIPNGEKGNTGNGIESISKTGTAGKTDTYTITYTDGTTTTFTVTNGTDGTSAGFGTPEISVDANVGTPYAEVTASGTDAEKVFTFAFHNLKGVAGNDGVSPNVTVTEINGGHSVKITDKDHPDGQTFNVMDGEDGASDAGEVTYDSSETYSDGTVGKAISEQSSQIAQLGSLKADKTALQNEVARLTAVNARQDKEIQFLTDASMNVLAKMVTDSTEAYQKPITAYPVYSARMADVKSIGAKSVVWNQLVSDNKQTFTGLSGTSTNHASYNPVYANHTYYIRVLQNTDLTSNIRNTLRFVDGNGNLYQSTEENRHLNKGVMQWIVTARSDSESGAFGVWCNAPDVDTNYSDFHSVDLTKMYPNDEPTELTDPRILAIEAYLTSHPEYNAGELISADCDKIVSQGKNLFDVSEFPLIDGFYINKDTGNYTATMNYSASNGYIDIHANTKYTLSGVSVTGAVAGFAFYDKDKNFISGTQDNTFTTPVNARYLRICSRNNGLTSNIQLEYGDSGTSYAPYVGTLGTMSIPVALRTAHPLRSAGTAYDYLLFMMVNGALKVDNHGKTGIIDLGTPNWEYQSNYERFRANVGSIYKGSTDVNFIPNMLSTIYKASRQADTQLGQSGYENLNMAFGVLGGSGEGYLYAVNTSYTNAETFKAAMSGVYLIYEKAEETVTDVTSFFPADFSNVLTIEDGGSLTFEQSETEFAIPNTEDIYYVKTQEVTA